MRGNLVKPTSNVGASVRIAAHSSNVRVPILVWNAILDVVKVLESESHLFEVVCTLHSARGLASGLNSGQEQTNKNADDGDDDEEFDERKATSSLASGIDHGRTSKYKEAI